MGTKGKKLSFLSNHLVGLIAITALLVTIVWFALSFRVEFALRRDNKFSANVVKYETTESGIRGANENGNFIFSQDVYDKNLGNRPYKEKVVSFTINNGEHKSQYFYDKSSIPIRATLNENIKFIDLNQSDGLILPSIEKKLIENSGHGILKYGQGFVDDGKRQLLISEKLMRYLGLDLSCVGKSLSLRKSVDRTVYQDKKENNTNYISMIDNDNIVGNAINNSIWSGVENYISQEFENTIVHIFDKFTIVGILNSDFGQISPYFSDIWMSTSSIQCYYNDNFPILSYENKYNSEGEVVQARVATYPNRDIYSLSRSVVKSGYVFPFFMRGGFVSETNAMRWSTQNYSQPITTYEIEYVNYRDAKEAYDYSMKASQNGYGNTAFSTNAYNYFTKVVKYDDTMSRAMLILFIIAMVILAEEIIRHIVFRVKEWQGSEVKESIFTYFSQPQIALIIAIVSAIKALIIIVLTTIITAAGGAKIWVDGYTILSLLLAIIVINFLMVLIIKMWELTARLFGKKLFVKK